MDETQSIVRMDILRINHAYQKLCRCLQPCYELDTQNRLVYCRECGAIVDPFDTLKGIARGHERINRRIEQIQHEADALNDYKPRLRVIKELESKYSGTTHSLVPSCPHCKEFFDLKDLLNVSWRSRSYHEKMKAEKGYAHALHSKNTSKQTEGD